MLTVVVRNADIQSSSSSSSSIISVAGCFPPIRGAFSFVRRFTDFVAQPWWRQKSMAFRRSREPETLSLFGVIIISKFLLITLIISFSKERFVVLFFYRRSKYRPNRCHDRWPSHDDFKVKRANDHLAVASSFVSPSALEFRFQLLKEGNDRRRRSTVALVPRSSLCIFWTALLNCHRTSGQSIRLCK